jgi:hypothetical protein
MSDYPPSRHGYPRHIPPGRPPDRVEYGPPLIDETDPRAPIGPPLDYPPRREPSYQDLVVPRVFVEPDEELDTLRIRSLRIAIVRDVLLIIFLMAATFYLGGLIFQ